MISSAFVSQCCQVSTFYTWNSYMRSYRLVIVGNPEISYFVWRMKHLLFMKTWRYSVLKLSISLWSHTLSISDAIFKTSRSQYSVFHLNFTFAYKSLTNSRTWTTWHQKRNKWGWKKQILSGECWLNNLQYKVVIETQVMHIIQGVQDNFLKKWL